MGMTMAEKILASKSGLSEIRPGQYVTAKIDLLMAGDSTAQIYQVLKEIGIDKVWDPSKVISLTDHDIPAPTAEAAERDVLRRKFVQEFGIKYWYDIGRGGICHQVLPEKGHVLPGSLILGCDSHTTSYGAFNPAATGTHTPEVFWLAAKGETWF